MAARPKPDPKKSGKSFKSTLGKSSQGPLKRLKKVGRPQPAQASPLVRLQKFLAAAGIGSRRDCEVLIAEGRIEVDGQIVTQLGTRIDPETADVRFDGERVRIEKRQYFILNKPPGVVSTSMDPSGRTRVVDLISSHQRVYNVGRLDKSSEGLILVTNDGEVAQYLTHPSYGIEKVYHVQVKGHPQNEDLQLLKQGVHLAEGIAKVKDIEIKKRQQLSTDLKITLDEGKNREIRRLLAKLGHKVVRLVRISIGPIQLGTLPQGAHRRLNGDEITALKEWIQKRLQQPVVSKPAEPLKVKPGSSSDPVKTKLAEGRPIHFEDVEKSQALRAAEREARQKKSGKRAGGKPAHGKPADGRPTASGKPPVKFNTRNVGGVGMSRGSGPRTGGGTGGPRTGTGSSRSGGPGNRTGAAGQGGNRKPSGPGRSSGRPSGAAGGGRPSGGRPGAGRPSGGKPSGGRPGAGGGRATGANAGPGKKSGPRSSGSKPGSPRGVRGNGPSSRGSAPKGKRPGKRG